MLDRWNRRREVSNAPSQKHDQVYLLVDRRSNGAALASAQDTELFLLASWLQFMPAASAGLRTGPPGGRILVSQRLNDRAVWTVIAVAAVRQVLQRRFHGIQFPQLSVEFPDVRLCECLDVPAGPAAVLPQA